MLGSETLDVVIGLVFIYLLYSLFATIIQEILASFLNFRSKILEIAIHRMLEEDSPSTSRYEGIKKFFFGKDRTTSFLSNAFYQHPLIKFLGEDNDKRKPSYITKETFSKVIIDLLRGESIQREEKPSMLIDAALRSGNTNWKSFVVVPNNIIAQIKEESSKKKKDENKKELVDGLSRRLQSLEESNEIATSSLAKVLKTLLNTIGVGIVFENIEKEKNLWKLNIPISEQTLSYLRSIWTDSQKDIDKFKIYLENWFDQTMDRATGWYKKYTQMVLFAIGLVLAVTFNVNTIEIVAKLESNPGLRAHVISQVDNFLKAHPNLENEMKEELASHAKTSNDTTQIKRHYESLIGRLDTLLSRSDSLVNGDIAKVNNILGLGLKSFFFNINKLKCHTCYSKATLGCYALFLFESLIGWLITAIAISLGAPFWFDLLNKLMKLRSSTAGNADNKKTQPGNAAERSPLERKG